MDKDWTGNRKSNMAQLGSHGLEEREKNDFYATDPKTLEIFLDKLKEDNISLHNNIWEPACGTGNLSKVLIDKGYSVYSTDKYNRGYGQIKDFLINNEVKNLKYDILTNPPYKFAQEFVEKSLEIQADGYYTLMLLKIQFLESLKRKKFFSKFPPKYIYVNSDRQLCAKNGDFDKYEHSAVCYCWYIWQKGWKGEPRIRWI